MCSGANMDECRPHVMLRMPLREMGVAGCNDACTVELQYTVNNGGRPIEKN